MKENPAISPPCPDPSLMTSGSEVSTSSSQGFSAAELWCRWIRSPFCTEVQSRWENRPKSTNTLSHTFQNLCSWNKNFKSQEIINLPWDLICVWGHPTSWGIISCYPLASRTSEWGLKKMKKKEFLIMLRDNYTFGGLDLCFLAGFDLSDKVNYIFQYVWSCFCWLWSRY